MRNRDISNSDNTIDSRDVDKMIEELEEERADWQESNELPDYLDTNDSKNYESFGKWTGEQQDKWIEWEESEEGEELKHLKVLRDGLDGYCEWNHGVTLIRDSYFTQYIKELVKDIDGLPDGLPDYIENNINWDGVAEDFQVDYTSEEYDGVTYWAR